MMLGAMFCISHDYLKKEKNQTTAALIFLHVAIVTSANTRLLINKPRTIPLTTATGIPAR